MTQLVHPEVIRGIFSRAMSEMYRAEVPQYGALCDLVSEVNAQVLQQDPEMARRLKDEGQLERLDVERHGAVRVGTAKELAVLRRLFAIMGMRPVGYYDLSVAGVPVHATAFRAVDGQSLDIDPFRVFTSLLRLELIVDHVLREQAEQILARRRIFTPACFAAIERAEQQGGLTQPEAEAFVKEALETFRWHTGAVVDLPTYQQLRAVHPLVADIVCFKGPHINHLTPRTLDIDLVQERMLASGIRPKKTIEGPPKREVPILLRQTSFLALEESIRFGCEGTDQGTHTARFGEVEQRGCALTHKGRSLYDLLLGKALTEAKVGVPVEEAMQSVFADFPDNVLELHREGLAFFAYEADAQRAKTLLPPASASRHAMVECGWLKIRPITYEDFLPVSAAGIFRSNLGGEARGGYQSRGNQAAFEQALGVSVQDEIALYQQLSESSFKTAMDDLWQCASIRVIA